VHTASSRGFVPYSTRGPARLRYIPRAYRTRYVPPPGFLTLLTACSAPTPPGLFHPGGAHGVRPFRAFSSRGAAAPSGARCPPDVHAAGPPRSIHPTSSRAGPWSVHAGTPSNRAEAGTRRLQGFAPLGSSWPSDGGLDRRRLDALLGFRLSRGPALASGPAIDTEQLPWPSRPDPATDRSRWLAPGVGLRSLPTRELRRSLSRSAAPPEISHLVTPLGSASAASARGHRFPSCPEPRRRAPSGPIWAAAPSRPKPERQDFHPCSLPESAE